MADEAVVTIPVSLEFRARKVPWTRHTELVAWSTDMEHRGQNTYRHAIVSGVTFQEYPDGSEVPSSFCIEDSLAQRLMDDLWNCGFRPSEGTGSAGALAATERHLQDMRKLVFEAPRVKVVEGIKSLEPSWNDSSSH